MFKSGIKMMLVIALAAAPIALVPQHAQAQTEAERNAYQAGYNNGVNDREHNKPLNLKTDNWKNENLQAYERGYEDGFHSRQQGDWWKYRGSDAEGYANWRDDQPGVNASDAERRAYQAGFNNGMNDRDHNKPLNLKTDNWHGQNLEIYRRGYEDGYNGREFHR
jgi:ribosome modulation factor